MTAASREEGGGGVRKISSTSPKGEPYRGAESIRQEERGGFGNGKEAKEELTPLEETPSWR